MIVEIKPTSNYYNPAKRLIDTENYLLIDSKKQRIVWARFIGVPKPLVLWQGEDYDQIGDWTQMQAENRVIELLGDNPKAVIESLFG